MLNIIVKGGSFQNQSAKHHVVGNDYYSVWSISLKGNIRVKRVNLQEKDIEKLNLKNLINCDELYEIKYRSENFLNLKDEEKWKIMGYEHYFQYL